MYKEPSQVTPGFMLMSDLAGALRGPQEGAGQQEESDWETGTCSPHLTSEDGGALETELSTTPGSQGVWVKDRIAGRAASREGREAPPHPHASPGPLCRPVLTWTFVIVSNALPQVPWLFWQPAQPEEGTAARSEARSSLTCGSALN